MSGSINVNDSLNEHRDNLYKLNNKYNNVDIILHKNNLLNYKSFLDLAKNFGSNKNNEIELELRFQNINKEHFDIVKKNIENDKYYLEKKIIKSTSSILPNNIRVETFIQPEGNITLYQIKNEIKSYKIFLNKIPIKLSLSRENNINPYSVTDKKNIITRNKNRTTYVYENFNIDLTTVNTIDNVKNTTYESYEVEIEFTNYFNIRETIVNNIIKYILKMLYPDKYSFLDQDSEISIRSEYIKMFPWIKNQRPDFIFENKPKNFKLTDVDNFNHSITNKLNGINFFLYYCYNNKTLYLINHSTVEYINIDTTYPNLKGNTLIQGELYHDISSDKNIFYIFDVLFVENNSVLNLNHPDRIKRFKSLFNKFEQIILKSGKSLILQYKKFYGFLPDENNFYDNLSKCEDSLQKDNNGNIDIEINDGFIFTPLDKPYINKETYKYKFPETMTIDFSVKLYSQDKNQKVYKLFVYNESKQLIQFNYQNKNYNLECNYKINENLCKEIKNDHIVECYFDKKNNVFVPYRIRYDKTLPNFYKVAYDVFNDIINPITLQDLKNSFKNKFSLKSSYSPIEIEIKQIETEIKKDIEEIKKGIEQIENDTKIEETLDIYNTTLKKNFDDLLECVLFSVSPEYREHREIKKNLMYLTALDYFENDVDKINNINLLAESFNIKIYILKEIGQNKYNIIKKSNNDNDNKLYIIDKLNSYDVLGYEINKTKIYIF